MNNLVSQDRLNEIKAAGEKLRKEFNIESNYDWTDRPVTLGGDPEFFFKTNKRGAIRGSERIIPPDGLALSDSSRNRVVTDGVQAEFNVYPDTCRQVVANNYRVLFGLVADEIKRKGLELKADFSSSVVKVSKTELQSLSESSRVFGCAPSSNTHMSGEEAKITVNPSEYTIRTAGGHIHLGGYGPVLESREKVVDVLDVVLGNTCVLLDREPMMAERRKVYGRAGEFRACKYGLEYRVLSNFWLRAYPLMSLVYSLARFAVHVVDNGYYDALMSVVNYERVAYAIDENDFDVALSNFMDFCVFLAAIPGSRYTNDTPSESLPIPFSCVDDFLRFVERGLDYWFVEDALDGWLNHQYATTDGWENFAYYNIPDNIPWSSFQVEGCEEGNEDDGGVDF
jgi:hypothetical protein